VKRDSDGRDYSRISFQGKRSSKIRLWISYQVSCASISTVLDAGFRRKGEKAQGNFFAPSDQTASIS
jgi:hypothetical protein